MILSIAGQKGGTGKTTIAVNLSPLLEDLMVVDTDPQGSFSLWSSLRNKCKKNKKIPTVQKFGEDIGEDIRELSDRYKNILIDCAGKDSSEFRATLLVSDIVIFPMPAAQFDMWTVSKLNTDIRDAKHFNKNLKAYFVLNKKDTNPQIKESKEAEELLSEIQNIDLFDTHIYNRIAYRRAPEQGKSVIEMDGIDGKARDEILGLYKEINNDRV